MGEGWAARCMFTVVDVGMKSHRGTAEASWLSPLLLVVWRGGGLSVKNHRMFMVPRMSRTTSNKGRRSLPLFLS